MQGAKLTLTPMLLEEIKVLANLGSFDKHIYRSLGIADRTWFRWKEKGREIAKQIEDQEVHESDLSDDKLLLWHLWHTMGIGRAKAVVRNLTLIQKAAVKNWTAARWFLEMIEPELYGKKKTIDLQHSGAVAQVELSEEEADRMRKELECFFPVRKKKERDANVDS